MEFRRGQFQINNKSSEEFNVFMRDRPERLSSGRVIELRERPGNSSAVFDFKYYKNVEWKILCYAKSQYLHDVVHLEEKIANWLDMNSYSDFYYYFDREHIYQAIVVSPPSFTGKRVNGNLIPFDFSISLKPFKETFTGREWIDLKNGDELYNPKNYSSKPKIHLLGKGDISFYINEKKYDLKKIDDEIIIDSLLEESYKVDTNRMITLDHKTTFLDFPMLPKELMQIKWTGNVSRFELLPRWWTKI
ncbi:phage tail protein [Vagococcus sp. JNUCC 83]